MEKITKLTPEQEARLPEYVEKWTKIGLSTEPANRPVTEEAVKRAYEVAGLPPPEHILWADSVWAGHELHCKLRGKSDWVTPYYGQHEAAWLGFYDVFRDIGVDVSKIDPLSDIGKNCGWVWMFENGAICTERPCELHQNERGQLHCKTGPAIKYPDGWSIYALNGTVVPEKVVMEPESFTRKDILALNNTEIVRALAEHLGWEKYLKVLGAKVIDSFVDPTTNLQYELLESEHKAGDLEPRFIRKQSSVLKDLSQPWYIEPVHPGLNTAMAARKFQAMAAFVEDNEDEYVKLMDHCNSNPDLDYSWER